MNNPLIHAFFVGRALAEAIGEETERAMTETLSNLGRFDAEQRELLRQFVTRVVERANQAEATSVETEAGQPTAGTGTATSTESDLQAMLDGLRAEIAQLRSTLQQYRNNGN